MARISYKVTVSGLVQGVGFRASMKDIAIRHAVDGWVRNTEGGSVEALLQGEPAGVNRVLQWAKLGPPGAEVSSVETTQLKECPPQSGFHVLVPEWSGRAPNR